MWLFLAFLSVPLIEIALFIQVGGWIGLWPTLGIVLLTAVAGTWLVRSQGQMALGHLRRSFETLDDPGTPLAHGAMILVAGALLLTPGFFTDAVGFALLAPPVRSALLAWLSHRIKVQQFQMGTRPHPEQTHGARPTRPASGDVIDGDYRDVSSDKPANHPGSGWTRH